MKPKVLFVLALFLFAVAGCSMLPSISRLASAAPPAPSPVPVVITVVVTPTPGPVAVEAVDADRIEAGRIAVYERVAPAVVNVTTQVLRSNFFRGAMPEEGSGSGFLWDMQGHIVTNNHVVEGAQRIEVSFGGDTSQPATVVGTDPINDLAVIKVNSVPEGVRPLEPGASAYNLLHPFKLDGRLDPIALERSLDEVVRRQEILRTTFAAPDGAPMQVIHPPRHQPLGLCPPRPAAGR